jgi:hypothetical protein
MIKSINMKNKSLEERIEIVEQLKNYTVYLNGQVVNCGIVSFDTELGFVEHVVYDSKGVPVLNNAECTCGNSEIPCLLSEILVTRWGKVELFERAEINKLEELVSK